MAECIMCRKDFESCLCGFTGHVRKITKSSLEVENGSPIRLRPERRPFLLLLRKLGFGGKYAKAV